MYLPTRTKQKKAESESYAVLLYKLRRIGIFRNMTESDYGIDFEIEPVFKKAVTGRYIKAQVKSAENLSIRKSDSVPTVGGIKQSTLLYWCELSYRSHVIAYAVDLKTETIYISSPLFWQATSLLDGTNSSKTIEFIPEVAKSGVVDQDTAVEALTVLFAISPNLPDTLYAITTAFRYLKDFFELRCDVFHYDYGTELARPEVFRAFLEVCSILLSHQRDKIPLPDEDRERAFSFEHWANKGTDDGEITCCGAQAPMKALLPMLVLALLDYRKKVVAGVHYWAFRNPEFFAIVHDTPVPSATDDKTLDDWGDKYNEVAHQAPIRASHMIFRARQASARPAAGEKSRKR